MLVHQLWPFLGCFLAASASPYPVQKLESCRSLVPVSGMFLEMSSEVIVNIRLCSGELGWCSLTANTSLS